MKNLWVVPVAALLAVSSSLRADSISSSTGNVSGFPTGFAPSTQNWINAPPAAAEGTPFWNNPSADSGAGGSHMMNVGYLLTDTGGFAGTPSVLGADTVTQSFATAGGDDPAAFNFRSTATPYNIGLLFSDSSLNTGSATHGTVFGYYVGSTFTPMYTPLDASSPGGFIPFGGATAGSSYGFYATVCYSAAACETYTTGNGNSGNVGGAAGWNHFALFELASGSYVIGFEDTNGFGGEGLGDFNDIVVEMKVADPVPEPGSMAILGLGLAGLALLGSKRNALQRLFVLSMLQRSA